MMLNFYQLHFIIVVQKIVPSANKVTPYAKSDLSQFIKFISKFYKLLYSSDAKQPTS